MRTRTFAVAAAAAVLALPTAPAAAETNVSVAEGASLAATFATVDGCFETTGSVYAAESASWILDPSEGGDIVWLTATRHDVCAETWSSVYWSGYVDAGALTIDEDLATARLTTAVAAWDYAIGAPVEVTLDVSWRNTGVSALELDQHLHVHSPATLLNTSLRYDSWAAEVAGSVRIGDAAIDLRGAFGEIVADRTVSVQIERLRLLTAARERTGGAVAFSFGAVDAVGVWDELEGCIQTHLDLALATTTLHGGDDAAYLGFTYGRFDTCTGEYEEWISNGVELAPAAVEITRGGEAVRLQGRFEFVSSVTLEPVAIDLDVVWTATSGREAEWELFTSQQVTSDGRAHWRSVASAADVGLDLTVGGVPVTLTAPTFSSLRETFMHFGR